MKNAFLIAPMILLLAACGSKSGEIEISMPKDGAPDKIIVAHDLISDLAKARQYEDLKTMYDTLKVENGKVSFPTDEKGDTRYMISFGDGRIAELYSSPGETLELDVDSYVPFAYTVSGTQLMEDITLIKSKTDPLDNKMMQKMRSGEVSIEDQQAYMTSYDNVMNTFISENPDSPAVIYALFYMQGEGYKKAYDNLSPKAKESILMPIISDQVARSNEVSEEMKAQEDAQANLANGDKAAPNFTFKDINGKEVSLSDFRGKWVVLDFWGTWCGWCIKGIPDLKAAYKKYAGKFEVIGIDCNETEAEWREGVKKYELPWVNVYNDQKDGQLIKEYKISGFPTKVIVNPEGKIVDITTGEDPAFYARLADFLKK